VHRSNALRDTLTKLELKELQPHAESRSMKSLKLDQLDKLTLHAINVRGRGAKIENPRSILYAPSS